MRTLVALGPHSGTWSRIGHQAPSQSPFPSTLALTTTLARIVNSRSLRLGTLSGPLHARKMKLIVFSLLAAAAAVSAQSVIDYTKIPACARQCIIIDQAEKGCVPPAAPISGQETYQSCLCASTIIAPLKVSGDLCLAVCAAPDASKITEYYNALCAGPVVQPPATTTLSTTTSSSTATGTAAPGAGNSVNKKKKAKPW